MGQRVSLGTLLEGIAPVPREVLLTDITLDSRQVTPGGAFLACRGNRGHGLDFAAEVVRRGAVAILWEPDGERAPPKLSSQIVVTAVPELGARASVLADRFFAAPSRELDVVGVTGTNGKTTCAWLLAQALSRCDLPAAYMGTLGSHFAARHFDSGMTTPDAVTVQRELAQFRDDGARSVAMEVSSHGLAQGRVHAVRFAAAVFTNLTRDHLDFHGDMNAYAAVKASLFERDDVRLRVFNVDDPIGAQWAANPRFAQRIACSSRTTTVPGGAYLKATNIEFDATGTRFELRSSFGVAQVNSKLVGAFNVDNLLAVMAVLLGRGISLPKVVEVTDDLQAPSGRLETISHAGQPLVVVDYAHTPDALEKVLQVLRLHCRGRLTVVFGCGGDRDRGKRPEMGAIAVQGADTVVITDDNPRTENGDQIVADILRGVASAKIQVIRDRQAAITSAVQAAGAEDVVLIAGKGHETYQIVGTESRPFSDQSAARAALAAAV
jgi:UDP-N-acetylmuramoyl-L-alanyl-D-glutamate--2,6-diaminopimelate ligase